MLRYLRLTGIWNNISFRKLWIGQTISVFGSAITQVALPLTAVVTLQATPKQMGFLGTAEFLPFFLISLFVGVLVDRLPRRPVLIWANIGRALLLCSIPVAAVFNTLRIEYMYFTAFCVGSLTVLFDVSYQAFLPSIAKREQLVEGNSKLQLSESIALLVGPGLAGMLVEMLTGAYTIAIDALSFIISALFIYLISTSESAQVESIQHSNIWREIGEGLQVIFKNPLLRSIAACTSTSNLFDNMITSMYIFYLTQELGIKPSILGIILGISSGGALLGAMQVGRIVRRFGIGNTIVGSRVIKGIGVLLIPLASGSFPVTIGFLATAGFITGLTNTIYNINQVSLRQTIIPDRLQGRLNASMRFLVYGTIPIGYLLGGIFSETIGVRAVILIGAIGTLLAFLWVFFSPVRTLVMLPEIESETR